MNDSLQTIADELDRIYDHQTWRTSGDPLTELLATILSQHTSDQNSSRAMQSLVAHFPTPASMDQATETEIAAVIACGGLARTKSHSIKSAVHFILAAGGEQFFAKLALLPVEEARRRLMQIPGVGPKTASCVLLFSLGQPAMPVDTHVHRVAKRLGLIPGHVSAEAAHLMLEALIGPDLNAVYNIHMNLIEHGRQTCHARQPACTTCPFEETCEYRQKARH